MNSYLRTSRKLPMVALVEETRANITEFFMNIIRTKFNDCTGNTLGAFYLTGAEGEVEVDD